MDRHFAAFRRRIASTPALADVRLVTVTLDPDFDTPAVLKAHARRREADPAIWTFLTGEPAEVNKFASQFGIYVEHNPQNAIDITHNLRTAVIDPDGRLVTVAHRQFLDAGRTRCRPQRRARSRALTRSSRRRLRSRRGASARRAPAHAGRRPDVAERAALQHRDRRRDAAQLSRRRPHRHGALPRGGALGRGRSSSSIAIRRSSSASSRSTCSIT